MALVLSRRAGESVKIGTNVTVTIREVHPKKVYVHVDRPSGDATFWMQLNDCGNLIGSGCSMQITGISRGIVKLSFMADRSVSIVRTELLK